MSEGVVKKLEEQIDDLSGGKHSKICIFSLGQRGMKLYYELRYKGIKVDFFSDNDINKQGHTSVGVECISPKELEKYKDNILIIVSNKNDEEIIIKQLQSAGFKYITIKSKVDELLEVSPPVKWITDLVDIDYSDPNILKIINIFNETIFNMYLYYEKKIEEMRKKDEMDK